MRRCVFPTVRSGSSTRAITTFTSLDAGLHRQRMQIAFQIIHPTTHLIQLCCDIGIHARESTFLSSNVAYHCERREGKEGERKRDRT